MKCDVCVEEAQHHLRIGANLCEFHLDRWIERLCDTKGWPIECEIEVDKVYEHFKQQERSELYGQ